MKVYYKDFEIRIILRKGYKMNKIQMQNPIVELDGDEMTRLMWSIVKDKLIIPFVDLKTEYYDLHIKNRDNTDDKVTVEAAEAIKKHKVGVKCATITANKDRQEEYNLKKISKSPNGTIRKILDGTVFRKPIIINTIKPIIPTWTEPITIARHSYGDLYLSTNTSVKAGSKAEIVITDPNYLETRMTIKDFKEDGIIQAYFNLDQSIHKFAETCFEYAIMEKIDLLFSAKDTVTQEYDEKFKDIFENSYNNKYKSKFEKLGIKYTYTLIDDAVSRVIKSNGGFLWACKNYDGDVMSDMVATGYGSLALMTSVLVSPKGAFEYEAAHGTVRAHYYRHLKGEETSTNPIAIIFAWSGALRKRGEMDDNKDLIGFAEILEKSTVDTINSGFVTKDLYNMSIAENKEIVTTNIMIEEIVKNLKIHILRA
jgi:isocitrate dehydrogenase